MGHATCAYLGGYEGRKYIYQSIDDPEILNIVQNAMLKARWRCIKSTVSSWMA